MFYSIIFSMKLLILLLTISAAMAWDQNYGNVIQGNWNHLRGSGNQIFGDQNQLHGNGNINIGFGSSILGSGNKIVGVGHNIIGSGIHMFGPTAHPSFYDFARLPSHITSYKARFCWCCININYIITWYSRIDENIKLMTAAISLLLFDQPQTHPFQTYIS